MCLNLPSCKVKNQLTFYKARLFKYSFFLVFSIFDVWGSANIHLQIPLKMGKKWRFLVQHILWSSKILFCFSNSHIRNVVSTLPNVVKVDVENDVVLTLANIAQFNVEIDNVDSTLLNVLNFIVDVYNVVSTLIWCCETLRRHIDLKTTLNRCCSFCWALVLLLLTLDK